MSNNKKKALGFIGLALLNSSVVYLGVGLLLRDYVTALWAPGLMLPLLFVVYLGTPLRKSGWLLEAHAGFREFAALVTRRNKPAA